MPTEWCFFPCAVDSHCRRNSDSCAQSLYNFASFFPTKDYVGLGKDSESNVLARELEIQITHPTGPPNQPGCGGAAQNDSPGYGGTFEDMSAIQLKSAAELVAIPQYKSGLILLNFWAAWSEPCKQLNAVVDQLAKEYADKGICFAHVEAEEIGDITERFSVESVPTFVFLKDGAVLDTLKGANPPELTKRVASLVQTHQKSEDSAKSAKEALNKRLADLIASHKVMAFIKGTPDAPQCGFSNKFVQILKKNGIEFGSFDILSDPDVRQGLKEYSNWPTYPQLYANSKLVGGFDIVKELDAEGELVATIQSPQ